MAVYTTVTLEEAAALAGQLGLGRVEQLLGITSGIENTNYFLTCESGEYVLTLFERLSVGQLPYYLHLMEHLAQRGLPVPCPVPDAQGSLLHSLAGKPTTIVNKLPGTPEMNPEERHCAALGEMLARLHLAGLDYPRQQPNLRGLQWMAETAPLVLPHLPPETQLLLESELQHHQSIHLAKLPGGPIHADLFRDNALFVEDTLTGIFDFYFAGNDSFTFDIAVCLNDWCIEPASGAIEETKRVAFLDAYASVRPLREIETDSLPDMLRLAGLRFWLSRLWDWHLPRAATQLKPHDPTHFERIVRLRRG